MTYNSKDLKDMSNAVRALALYAVRVARSGHIGIVLGVADVITSVFANFLRRGRDKFVMSAGHGSALLYSVLKLAGYKVADLKSFRKVGGLPGHPERGIDGVDVTTGPLGQGVANAVGMALAEKIKNTDAIVYCVCSDGDLMEGVAQEAIAFAGRYKLNNLVLLWDDNGLSIDGTAQTDSDMLMRMVGAGWKVLTADGNNFSQIARALDSVKKSKMPVFVQCKTVLGQGSRLENTSKAHGLALSDFELGDLIQKFASQRGDELWRDFVQKQIPVVENKEKYSLPHVTMQPVGGAMSTRELSGIYLNELLKAGAKIIGGSADLGGSTNARVESSCDIKPNKFAGNYINYGVREHAMAAIMNGVATSGLHVYGSTFLVFSDYMRPSIRLSALSGLPVIYVLTHDSVAVGEDGPTHQPIEQLPSLRLIPNLNVFRPCNGIEVMYVWRRALLEKSRPSCIVLSRQQIKLVSTPLGSELSRGAYVIYPSESKRVRATILATGSEVPLAIEVAKKLGNAVQVVSVLSVADFRKQDVEYKKQMLAGLVVAIEAAASAPWFEFADVVFGIDEFGMSGDGAEVYQKFGFDADIIAADIKNKIK